MNSPVLANLKAIGPQGGDSPEMAAARGVTGLPQERSLQPVPEPGKTPERPPEDGIIDPASREAADADRSTRHRSTGRRTAGSKAKTHKETPPVRQRAEIHRDRASGQIYRSAAEAKAAPELIKPTAEQALSDKVDKARSEMEDLRGRFYEPVIDKKQLIQQARQRVEAAQSELGAAKTATVEQYRDLRKAATAEYDRVDQAFRAAADQEKASISLKLPGQSESDLQLAIQTDEMVRRDESPFEVVDYKVGNQKVKRMAFHSQSGMVVVQRWDSENGNLLAVDLLKSPKAVELVADTESKSPITFLRGEFRELRGSSGRFERLSSESLASLGKLSSAEGKQPEAHRSVANYDGYYSPALRRSLEFMEVPPENFANKAKRPRRGFSFWIEQLFRR